MLILYFLNFYLCHVKIENPTYTNWFDNDDMRIIRHFNPTRRKRKNHDSFLTHKCGGSFALHWKAKGNPYLFLTFPNFLLRRCVGIKAILFLFLRLVHHSNSLKRSNNFYTCPFIHAQRILNNICTRNHGKM